MLRKTFIFLCIFLFASSIVVLAQQQELQKSSSTNSKPTTFKGTAFGEPAREGSGNINSGDKNTALPIPQDKPKTRGVNKDGEDEFMNLPKSSSFPHKDSIYLPGDTIHLHPSPSGLDPNVE